MSYEETQTATTLSSKVMAVNLPSHFGPSCPEVKISIHHHSGEYHAVISWLVVRQKEAARHSLYIKNDNPDGRRHRPHGNFTPPHADGATVNAVKRSNRKYHCINQKIIAGQIAISTLS
ncbi:hypothetical protein [Oscillibacter sp.]|uniref:hypothetical protein n=1 Tax=Oscillibacter sp. TaxID=1945593 RepID=UPI00289B7E09|nr:hypothetical protein [Oscillibacter sp.]